MQSQRFRCASTSLWPTCNQLWHRLSCPAVQENEGASRQQQSATWEEQRAESKYARTLEQLPPDRKISPHPNDWVCDSTEVTDNLWLNLSTGNIGSGRMHWDGSGGNGATSARSQPIAGGILGCQSWHRVDG